MAKKTVFYKIYFGVIALFLIALTVTLVWLNGWLKSYEAAQADNLIKSIVENHIKTGDTDYLKTNCSLKISEYEKEENTDNLLKRLAEQKNDISTVVCPTRPDGCDAAYTVKLGEERILNIYFNKQQNSTSFLPKYSVMGAEFDKSYYKSISLSMPQNVDITVNGKKLDEAHRVDEQIPEFVANYLKGENAIKQQSAVIDYLLSEDAQVLASISGESTLVTKDGNSFSVYPYIEDSIKQKVKDVATGGSKAYAGYMQTDATLGEVAQYFDTGCDFYKNIRSSYTDHILEHTPAGFDDLKNDEVFKYSDNIYSCRVKFTQVLKRNGMTYKIYFNKYVFVKKSGDSFKIIDIKSPENN